VKHELYDHLCPRFQVAMDVLAKPWNGLIMATLGTAGPLRYSELRTRLVAMGDRMLSTRLKELEARGLVERSVSPGPPVRVDYALSEAGHGFRDVAVALSAWGARFAPAPAQRAEVGAKRRPRAARGPRRLAAP
jgi:DNA-binding HxlR family transcriptional regulator